MTERCASSKNALGLCDVCGFQYKLKELQPLFVKGRNTHMHACEECWSPDHPQLKLGEFPVNDPQAIRNPRPDQSLSADSSDTSSRAVDWGWNPVGTGPNTLIEVKAGTVTVTVE